MVKGFNISKHIFVFGPAPNLFADINLADWPYVALRLNVKTPSLNHALTIHLKNTTIELQDRKTRLRLIFKSNDTFKLGCIERPTRIIYEKVFKIYTGGGRNRNYNYLSLNLVQTS